MDVSNNEMKRKSKKQAVLKTSIFCKGFEFRYKVLSRFSPLWHFTKLFSTWVKGTNGAPGSWMLFRVDGIVLNSGAVITLRIHAMYEAKN